MSCNIKSSTAVILTLVKSPDSLKPNSNAYKCWVLRNTNNSKRGILIDLKEPASGFCSMAILSSGDKATLRVSFGYPQIQDAENQFYPDPLSMKT